MKKFSFSLQKILNFKQQRLDILINELQNMQMNLRKTEESIVKTNELYNQTGRELDDILRTGTSKLEIITHNTYLHSLISKANELYSQKASLEAQIEHRQNEIVDIKSDIKGLEKLRDKQYQEYLSENQKKLERDVEEFVMQKAVFN